MLPRLVIVVLLAVLPATAQLRSSAASVVMRAEMPQTLGITLTNDAGSLKADANWRLNPAIASQIQLQASLIAARSPAAPRFVLAGFHAGAESAAATDWREIVAL